ncbi:MAG: threonine aldolase family protein [bacterium]
MNQLIDLRSDTVTRPGPGMLAAMARAETGDDVFGEDPSVNRLEAMIAERLGHEDALFVPTGTMANQIAVGVHTRPGEELICDPNAHVYLWEGGGIARLWGVTPRTIAGPDGLLDEPTLAASGLRPGDCHSVITRLLCLENTHNRAGGRVLPIERIEAMCQWAKNLGLARHLDGARIWNASVASGVPLKRWAAGFDTVSVCFSKGLGCPMGSAIVGPREIIRGRAHRLRKVLGGAMRQVGVVAAAAIYALEHAYIDELAKDHTNARIIGEAVGNASGISLESGPPETNLVWIKVDHRLGSARYFSTRLKEKGFLVSVLGDQVVRACTHRDVTEAQVRKAAAAISQTADEMWRLSP